MYRRFVVLTILLIIISYAPLYSAPSITEWIILSNHQSQGEIATLASGVYVEPRTATIDKFQVVVDEALDPNFVDVDSVLINGIANGDISSTIDTVMLDLARTAITVELSSPLPANDTYSIALSNSILSISGETVIGNRTVGIVTLPGDVNQSGEVDLTDLIAIRNRLGTFNAAEAHYDVDTNGTVDEDDLVIVRNQLNNLASVPTAVTVSPYKAWIPDPNETRDLLVSVYFSTGEVYDLSLGIHGTQYSIAEPNVVEVSIDGVVSTIQDGNTSITASIFGLSDDCNVRVITQPAIATDESGWIDGIVYDATTDMPLENAIITVEGEVGRVLSGLDGKFAFPSSGSGLFFITIYKDGFTYHQRRVEVTRTLDSASYPAYLLPQAEPLQPQSMPQMLMSSSADGSVSAQESGQMYTNDCGTIQMIFPTSSRFSNSSVSFNSPLSMVQASSASAQTPLVTATQVTRSIELPDELPEQSEFTYAFFFDVDGENELPEPVTIRFANTLGFDPNTPIPVGRWNDKLFKWEHEALAMVTPDGQWVEYQASRFSAHDINIPAPPPPQQDSPDPDDPNNTSQSQPPNQPGPGGPGGCNGVSGSSFIMTRSGQLYEDHTLPAYRSLGQDRTTRLVYNSRAANPGAFIAYDLNQNPATTITPDAHGFRVSIEGRQYESWTQGADGMRRQAFMWDGKNDRGNLLPTGCYFYYLTFTNEYESVYADAINGRFAGPPGVPTNIRTLERNSYPYFSADTVSIVNERNSPFGAGWTVSGLQRLHINSGQTRAVLVDGSGSTVTFKTGLDLVVGNYFSILAILGNGDGTFQDQQSFATNLSSRAVVVCDFNGDGRQDVATVNSSYNNISILLGNGDGTFQDQQLFTVGTNPWGIAIGDFNQDGKQDVATANNNSSNISMLIGNGDGTFQSEQRFTVGSRPRNIAVGDFNGDGKQDVTTSNSNSNNISILLGNGDGTFQDQQLFTVGTKPWGIAIGDFNQDGKEDVATANNKSNNISILLGNGEGTFQNQQLFAVGSEPENIAIGDFNGDGKQDVAVANTYPGSISMLIGNGEGTFQSEQRLATGEYTEDIVVSDFNGDGCQDIAVTNLYSFDISVLIGNGEGTFQSEQLPIFGDAGPRGITVGDLDTTNGVFTAPFGENSHLKRNPDQTYTRKMKDGTVHTFDSDGFQTQTVDRIGNTTTYEYLGTNMDKKIWKITDPAGLVTTYNYTGDVLTSITDPSGRTTQFKIDENNDLVKITNPDGSFRQLEYDSNYLLTAQIDASGMRTEYVYDYYGCVTEVIKAVGTPEEQHKYFQASVNQGLINDLPPGVGTRYNPAPVVRPSDIQESYTNGEGETTSYYTNDYGSMTKIDHSCACGGPTQIERDSFNRITMKTYPEGNQIGYEYDSKGNVTKITNYGIVPAAETLIQYDSVRNRPIRIEDPENHVTTMTYDPANGNLLTMTDPMTYQTVFAYNSYGQVETITNAENEVVQFVYYSTTDPNGFGNLHQIIVDPAGLNLVTTIEYDQYGNVWKTTDAENKESTFVYDIMNLLRFATDGENQVTEYRYEDALGTISHWLTSPSARLIKIIDARSIEAVYYDYDSLHRLKTKTNILGKTHTYSYDNADRLITITDPKSQTINYTYDDLGRLITKTRPISGGTETVTYEYDLNSNLTRLTDDDSELIFDYDSADRLITYSSGAIAGQPALPLNYTYHDDGMLDTMVSPSGTTTYTHNSNKWLRQIIDPASRVTVIDYDYVGRRTLEFNHNGTSVHYSYDDASRVTGKIHKLGATQFLPLSYTYDNAGNILTMTDPNGTHSYGYDDIYQLASATHPNPVVNPNESYTFDPAGNRTTSHLSASHSHNNANQLTEDDDYTYTYDDNGNMETKTAKVGGVVTTYTYDSEDRLVRVDMPGGVWAEYKYDALGRRIEKNVNGTITRYTYDGEDILYEYDGSNNTVARYTHGPGIDEPLIMERAGQLYYYHTDHQGSVRALTDSIGTTVQSYMYDSFGQIKEQRGTIQNPYAYTGREFDPESGLYYYRNRIYAPNIGRFLQTDPIGHLSGVNLYSYVSNNPMNWIDPYGLEEEDCDEEPEPDDQEQSFLDWLKSLLGNFLSSAGPTGTELITNIHTPEAARQTPYAITGLSLQQMRENGEINPIQWIELHDMLSQAQTAEDFEALKNRLNEMLEENKSP